MELKQKIKEYRERVKREGDDSPGRVRVIVDADISDFTEMTLANREDLGYVLSALNSVVGQLNVKLDEIIRAVNNISMRVGFLEERIFGRRHPVELGPKRVFL